MLAFWRCMYLSALYVGLGQTFSALDVAFRRWMFFLALGAENSLPKRGVGRTLGRSAERPAERPAGRPAGRSWAAPVSPAAPKKNNLIEAAPFRRLDQM